MEKDLLNEYLTKIIQEDEADFQKEYHHEPHLVHLLNITGGKEIKSIKEIIEECVQQRLHYFRMDSSTLHTIKINYSKENRTLICKEIDYTNTVQRIYHQLNDIVNRHEFRAMDTKAVLSNEVNTILNGYFCWEFDCKSKEMDEISQYLAITKLMNLLIEGLNDLCESYCSELEKLVYASDIDSSFSQYEQGGNCYFGYFFLSKVNLQGLKIFFYIKGKDFEDYLNSLEKFNEQQAKIHQFISSLKVEGFELDLCGTQNINLPFSGKNLASKIYMPTLLEKKDSTIHLHPHIVYTNIGLALVNDCQELFLKMEYILRGQHLFLEDDQSFYLMNEIRKMENFLIMKQILGKDFYFQKNNLSLDLYACIVSFYVMNQDCNILLTLEKMTKKKTKKEEEEETASFCDPRYYDRRSTVFFYYAFILANRFVARYNILSRPLEYFRDMVLCDRNRENLNDEFKNFLLKCDFEKKFLEEKILIHTSTKYMCKSCIVESFQNEINSSNHVHPLLTCHSKRHHNENFWKEFAENFKNIPFTFDKKSAAITDKYIIPFNLAIYFQEKNTLLPRQCNHKKSDLYLTVKSNHFILEFMRAINYQQLYSDVLVLSDVSLSLGFRNNNNDSFEEIDWRFYEENNIFENYNNRVDELISSSPVPHQHKGGKCLNFHPKCSMWYLIFHNTLSNPLYNICQNVREYKRTSKSYHLERFEKMFVVSLTEILTESNLIKPINFGEMVINIDSSIKEYILKCNHYTVIVNDNYKSSVIELKLYIIQKFLPISVVCFDWQDLFLLTSNVPHLDHNSFLTLSALLVLTWMSGKREKKKNKPPHWACKIIKNHILQKKTSKKEYDNEHKMFLNMDCLFKQNIEVLFKKTQGEDLEMEEDEENNVIDFYWFCMHWLYAFGYVKNVESEECHRRFGQLSGALFSNWLFVREFTNYKDYTLLPRIMDKFKARFFGYVFYSTGNISSFKNRLDLEMLAVPEMRDIWLGFVKNNIIDIYIGKFIKTRFVRLLFVKLVFEYLFQNGGESEKERVQAIFSDDNYGQNCNTGRDFVGNVRPAAVASENIHCRAPREQLAILRNLLRIEGRDEWNAFLLDTELYCTGLLSGEIGKIESRGIFALENKRLLNFYIEQYYDNYAVFREFLKGYLDIDSKEEIYDTGRSNGNDCSMDMYTISPLSKFNKNIDNTTSCGGDRLPGIRVCKNFGQGLYSPKFIDIFGVENIIAGRILHPKANIVHTPESCNGFTVPSFYDHLYNPAEVVELFKLMVYVDTDTLERCVNGYFGKLVLEMSESSHFGWLISRNEWRRGKRETLVLRDTENDDDVSTLNNNQIYEFLVNNLVSERWIACLHQNFFYIFRSERMKSGYRAKIGECSNFLPSKKTFFFLDLFSRQQREYRQSVIIVMSSLVTKSKESVNRNKRKEIRETRGGNIDKLIVLTENAELEDIFNSHHARFLGDTLLKSRNNSKSLLHSLSPGLILGHGSNGVYYTSVGFVRNVDVHLETFLKNELEFDQFVFLRHYFQQADLLIILRYLLNPPETLLGLAILHFYLSHCPGLENLLSPSLLEKCLKSEPKLEKLSLLIQKKRNCLKLLHYLLYYTGYTAVLSTCDNEFTAHLHFVIFQTAFNLIRKTIISFVGIMGNEGKSLFISLLKKYLFGDSFANTNISVFNMSGDGSSAATPNLHFLGTCIGVFVDEANNQQNANHLFLRSCERTLQSLISKKKNENREIEKKKMKRDEGEKTFRNTSKLLCLRSLLQWENGVKTRHVHITSFIKWLGFRDYSLSNIFFNSRTLLNDSIGLSFSPRFSSFECDVGDNRSYLSINQVRTLSMNIVYITNNKSEIYLDFEQVNMEEEEEKEDNRYDFEERVDLERSAKEKINVLKFLGRGDKLKDVTLGLTSQPELIPKGKCKNDGAYGIIVNSFTKDCPHLINDLGPSQLFVNEGKKKKFTPQIMKMVASHDSKMNVRNLYENSQDISVTCTPYLSSNSFEQEFDIDNALQKRIMNFSFNTENDSKSFSENLHKYMRSLIYFLMGEEDDSVKLQEISSTMLDEKCGNYLERLVRIIRNNAMFPELSVNESLVGYSMKTFFTVYATVMLRGDKDGYKYCLTNAKEMESMRVGIANNFMSFSKDVEKIMSNIFFLMCYKYKNVECIRQELIDPNILKLNLRESNGKLFEEIIFIPFFISSGGTSNISVPELIHRTFHSGYSFLDYQYACHHIHIILDNMALQDRELNTILANITHNCNAFNRHFKSLIFIYIYQYIIKCNLGEHFSLFDNNMEIKYYPVIIMGDIKNKYTFTDKLKHQIIMNSICKKIGKIRKELCCPLCIEHFY